MVPLLYLVYRATDRAYPYLYILLGDLADFILHLFDRVGLAAATIHTYKVAISSALESRQSFSTSVSC